jgi:UDP-N-acetylglucosamine--N-acetylmuramyl-(pentapeptide) pyrophosphoryl-undecaprenol N-acetylglucosamine transferase
VLVPLPGAPGDHQTANARAFRDAGAAVVVPDAELTPGRLAEELDTLLAAPERMAAMAAAARGLAHPDAAERVAKLVEESASRG